MASSGNTCCLICCESEQMPELSKSDQMVKLFFKDLKTYLLSYDGNETNLVKNDLDKFANTPNCLCEKCLKLMESFVDLYKILRETELKLGEKLLELQDGLLMECSKVTLNLDERNEFRGALGRICGQQADEVLQNGTKEDSANLSRSRVKRKFYLISPVEDVPEAKRIKEDNSDQQCQKNVRDQLISKTKYPCNVETCKEIMFSLQDLQKHKKFHGSFSCKNKNCGEKFEYALDLPIHEKIHCDQRKSDVGVCPRKACNFKPNHSVSDSKKEAEYVQHFLKSHLKLDVPKHTMSCAICSMGFSQKANFNSHFDSCHNLDKLGESEQAWICDWDSDECTAYFLNSDQLAKHKFQMHSGKFECDECADTFSTIIELRRHLIGAHGKNELTISIGKNSDGRNDCVPEAQWKLPDFSEVERIDVGEVKEEKSSIDSKPFLIEDDELIPASIKEESGMQ